MPKYTPSQALIDRRAARRAAAAIPRPPPIFQNGVGRDVYVQGLVGDLLQVVGALGTDNLRCIAEYYVDGGQIACVVSGLGYADHHLKCKLTTKIGHQVFLLDPESRCYLGSSGFPPVELTIRSPTTGSRVLLRAEQDVGTLLHLSGFTWQDVLQEQFHFRPTLHLARRFRHLKGVRCTGLALEWL